MPRARDKGGAGEVGRIGLAPKILPPHLKRTKSIAELIPWLGFWKALPHVFGNASARRCWLHKTAKVLNQLFGSDTPGGLRPTGQGLVLANQVWGRYRN